MTDPIVTGSCAAYAAVTVGLATLSLGLFACVAAMWERWVIGGALLAAAGDKASAYAHIRDIDLSNRLLDQAAQRACAKAYRGPSFYSNAVAGSDETGDGSWERPFKTDKAARAALYKLDATKGDER
jgi:hypothetical protein